MMGQPQRIAARVARLDPAGEGILRLVLAPVGAGRFPAWVPGAHVDLILPGTGRDALPEEEAVHAVATAAAFLAKWMEE